MNPHGRDVQQPILRQTATRVDEAEAVALLDELEDESAQECRLPGARLADDVGGIAGINASRRSLTSLPMRWVSERT